MLLTYQPSVYAFAAFLTIFVGYMIQTMLLQFIFYYCRAKDCEWKVQNNRLEHVGQLWGWPLLSQKPNRSKFHKLFTSINIVLGSLFAALTAEFSVKGWNRMVFLNTVSIQRIFVDCLVAVVFQSVAEYYWHRLMHTKYFYAALHKHHHFYKSPEPWDDMYIHPLEAAGYYCILYGPPFLFTMHYLSFLAYMVVMGLCGVMDHSGIRFEVPGIYNTVDHDNHHLKFEVNYSFPFPYMDILHGTYDGELLGVRFRPSSTGSGLNAVSKQKSI
jgi:sterol desaturase/sphingolipid hydroxylase (fatty acid hydroxylase superfamily)